MSDRESLTVFTVYNRETRSVAAVTLSTGPDRTYYTITVDRVTRISRSTETRKEATRSIRQWCRTNGYEP